MALIYIIAIWIWGFKRNFYHRGTAPVRLPAMVKIPFKPPNPDRDDISCKNFAGSLCIGGGFRGLRVILRQWKEWRHVIITHSVFNGNCPAYLSDTVQSSDSQCHQTASSPTTILIDRLRVTTTSHQVRRGRPFSRWSVCMEQTAWRHSRRIWHRQLSKTSQNSLL